MNQLFKIFFEKIFTKKETLPQETFKDVMISVSKENQSLRNENEEYLVKCEQLSQSVNILIDTLITLKNQSIDGVMKEINYEVNQYIKFTIVNYGISSYRFIDLVRAEITTKDENLVNKFVDELLILDENEYHTKFENLKKLYLSKHQENKFSSIDKNDIKNILIAFGNGIIPDNHYMCKMISEKYFNDLNKQIEFKKDTDVP